MVFASPPLHAFFGVVLMGTREVLGRASTGRSNCPGTQIFWVIKQLGGGIAWSAGEVPLVVVMIALLVQWSRSDRRTAKRLDLPPSATTMPIWPPLQQHARPTARGDRTHAETDVSARRGE